MRVYDTVLYAAIATDIRCYDIGDPANPSVLTVIEEGARTIHFWDDYCSFAQDAYGFKLYDISDPTSPEFILHQEVDGQTNAAAGKDGFIYVANGNNGLKVYELILP